MGTLNIWDITLSHASIIKRGVEVCNLLQENSVYTLYISSKWLRDFSLNFDTLIIGSVEIFVHPIVWNLKHLRIHNSQLLVNTYYLEVFWDGVIGKLNWRYSPRNGPWRWCLYCGHMAFSGNTFWLPYLKW